MRRFRIKEPQTQCCNFAAMSESLGGGQFRAK